MATTQQPLTDQQLNEIDSRAEGIASQLSGWLDRFAPIAGQERIDRARNVLTADVPALVAEIRGLRAALTEIRHLHKDSPMGPCPLCIDADALAAGGDGLVSYPCPTARLAGAQDCDPPHVRAARASVRAESRR